MLAMALASIKPAGFRRSRSQAFTLKQIKSYVEQNLSNPNLNTALIAAAVGLSPRRINALFAQEDTSLMRYVLQRRLERCYQDIQNQEYKNLRISDIAFHRGFNDLSHFSRTFRRRFGFSPRELQASAHLNQGLPHKS
jgi:AraC-like DNA-binding protein